MTENIYAAPAAEVRDTYDTSEQIRIYSPIQVACGTIGGPIGLIYFLKANFAALRNQRLERITLIAGFILMPVLLVSIAMLPDDFPSLPFAIAYIFSALYVSNKYQMTKQAIIDSPQHDFQSSWRVLWIGLLCLVVSFIVLIVPIAALTFFGLVD